jgi:hypothetical protein
MWEGYNIGISVPRGWIESFATLCVEIDELLGEDKRGFHWVQVKEKFGTARFYWHMQSPGPTHIDDQSPHGHASFKNASSAGEGHSESSLQQRIGTLVASAEKETAKRCAMCGAFGNLDSTGGYYLTLCSAHSKQRHDNTLQSMWEWGQDE